MALSEFEIIRRYFSAVGAPRDDVELGVGDDAAVLTVPPGQRLVVTTDTLVAGVHFPAQMTAADIGYRALAVNLSDLAAMAAEPAWASLALTLPEADPAWLEDFARGFGELAGASGVRLVGGDTCRGPLTVSVTLQGLLAGGGLRRSGARPGDAIFVTGTPGDAARGLELVQAGRPARSEAERYLVERFTRPQARTREGLELADVASAAIDVSDGLAADLGRLAGASGLGARLRVEDLPLSAALQEARGETAPEAALHGGDDYELCFTVPTRECERIERLAAHWPCQCTRIGEMFTGAGVECRTRHGEPLAARPGFDHFRG